MVTIRDANVEDAAEIANVHVNSWRESYQGLIPQDYLDSRPLHFKNRYELWKKVCARSNQSTFVAESSDHGIVGFIHGAHGRDESFKDWCEVWSLYLLQRYQGQKVGFRLLKKLFDTYQELGFSKGYLWVVKNNPTISFYKRVGGRFNGKEKIDTIGGAQVSEQMYVWDSLILLDQTEK